MEEEKQQQFVADYKQLCIVSNFLKKVSVFDAVTKYVNQFTRNTNDLSIIDDREASGILKINKNDFTNILAVSWYTGNNMIPVEYLEFIVKMCHFKN